MTCTIIHPIQGVRPNRFLLGAGLAAALLSWGLISAQQPPVVSAPQPGASNLVSSDQESTLEVIPMRHISARDAVGVIVEFIPDDTVITVDPRTNALIVAGSKEAQAIVRQLVARLDVEVEVDDHRPARRDLVHIYQLNSANADHGLATMLGSLFNTTGTRVRGVSSALRVAYDEASNQIIARGSERELASLEDMINAIDRAPAGGRGPSELRVRLAWLVGGLDQGAGTKIPPDMGEVIRELDKLGIDELRLAAQTIVRVSADQRFHTQFVANLIEPWSMSFTGRTANGPGGAVTLDLKLHGERLSGTAVSKLETSISTVSGHFVVLGVSPIQNLKSVFVIQVTQMK